MSGFQVYIKYALDFPGKKANLHLPLLNILGGCAMLGSCTLSFSLRRDNRKTDWPLYVVVVGFFDLDPETWRQFQRCKAYVRFSVCWFFGNILNLCQHRSALRNGTNLNVRSNPLIWWYHSFFGALPLILWEWKTFHMSKFNSQLKPFLQDVWPTFVKIALAASNFECSLTGLNNSKS